MYLLLCVCVFVLFYIVVIYFMGIYWYIHFRGSLVVSFLVVCVASSLLFGLYLCFGVFIWYACAFVWVIFCCFCGCLLKAALEDKNTYRYGKLFWMLNIS